MLLEAERERKISSDENCSPRQIRHLKQRDEADTRCTWKDWPEGGCREMEFVCKCEFTLPWH